MKILTLEKEQTDAEFKRPKGGRQDASDKQGGGVNDASRTTEQPTREHCHTLEGGRSVRKVLGREETSQLWASCILATWEHTAVLMT